MQINQIEWDLMRERDQQIQVVIDAWNELNRFDQSIIYRKWNELAIGLEVVAKEDDDE